MATDRPQRMPNIAAMFAASHASLDARLVEVAGALARDDIDRAERAFAVFARGLRHHMRVEETFLFAQLERVGESAERELVVRLRGVHQRIEAVAGLVARRLAERRGLGSELAALASTIDEHEREEERELFPACDQRIRPEVCAEAIAALERWPRS